MPDAIVQFEHVTFRYDITQALHEVSFTLHRGEIVGMLGPNGAGRQESKLIYGEVD